MDMSVKNERKKQLKQEHKMAGEELVSEPLAPYRLLAEQPPCQDTNSPHNWIWNIKVSMTTSN